MDRNYIDRAGFRSDDQLPDGLDDFASTVLGVIDAVARDALPSHALPSTFILGSSGAVFELCGSFAGPMVARRLNEVTGRGYRAVKTTHERPVGGGHLYLVEFKDDPEQDEIIDPTAGQFLLEVPDDLRGTQLMGNMFIGTRGQLRALVSHPDVTLQHLSTALDKELSFERIWGSRCEEDGVINPDEFYGPK